MTIYSWNMLYRNKRLDRAFEFIRDSGFDIFCLQEVPESFLKRLTTLPFSISYRRDIEKLFDAGHLSMSNVILSRHPIRATKDIPFPDYQLGSALRTRLFMRIMPWRFPETRDRGGIYADIDIGGTLVRVFNMHLTLSRPAWRLKEFELAMAEHEPKHPAIVCGDFNTLEKPHITVLNWLFGAPARDAALYTRERTVMEKRFVEHGLINPLRGKSTHGLSRSQLDHILVSHHLAVRDALVIPDRYGSDHHPIRTVLELDSA